MLKILFKKYFLIFSILPIIAKNDINTEIAICEQKYNQALTFEKCDQLQNEFDNYINNLKNKLIKIHDSKQITEFIKKIILLKKGLNVQKAWFKYDFSCLEMLLTILTVLLGFLILSLIIYEINVYKFKKLDFFVLHHYLKLKIFDIPFNFGFLKEFNKKNIDNYNDDITIYVNNNFNNNYGIKIVSFVIVFLYIIFNLITNYFSSFDNYCFNGLMLKKVQKNDVIKYQDNYYLSQEAAELKNFYIDFACNKTICKDGMVFYMIPTLFHNYRCGAYNWINFIAHIIFIIINFVLAFVRILTTLYTYMFVLFMLIYKLYSIFDYYCLFNNQRHLFDFNHQIFERKINFKKKIFFVVNWLLLTVIASIINIYGLEAGILTNFCYSAINKKQIMEVLIKSDIFNKNSI